MNAKLYRYFTDGFKKLRSLIPDKSNYELFMDVVLELLKLLIPAGAVFATAYFLIKNFLEAEEKKRLTEIRKNNQDLITPIRLQAYERLVLFLDRISPDIVIM